MSTLSHHARRENSQNEALLNDMGYSRRGRNTLDLTLTTRYAGLPNNAKLELVKAAKSRTEAGEVTIALQLENGERLQEKFQNTTTLWELLKHWENKPEFASKDKLTEKEGLHPVCIYMREEVVGEFALQETTMKSLGLLSGRAIVRLLHRAVDSNVLEEIKGKIEKEKQRQTKLATKATEMRPEEAITPSAVPTVADEPMDISSADTTKDTAATEPKPPVQAQTKNEHTSSEPMDTQTDESSTITKAARREQEKPKDQKPKQDSNKESGDIPGVQVFRPGEIQFTQEEREQMARFMAQMHDVMPPGLQVQPAPSQALARPIRQPVQQPTFMDFKFPEETKGQDLYHNELSNANKEDFKPCDRDIVVYSVNKTGPMLTSDEEIPDDFFEVTERDVRMMWEDQQKKALQEAEQPLMTQSMKRALQDARLSKYPRAILRIHFPEKVVLQAVFRPRETVHAVQKFVKEHLEDTNLPFSLYTSPPKCVLRDKAQTLIEANLVPMTVVYFSCDVNKDFYLSKTLLQAMASEAEATSVLVKHMPMKQSAEEYKSSHTGASASQGSSHKRSSSHRDWAADSGSQTPEGSKGGGNVPKWFKVGKK